MRAKEVLYAASKRASALSVHNRKLRYAADDAVVDKAIRLDNGIINQLPANIKPRELTAIGVQLYACA
jgi:hypothetical protein